MNILDALHNLGERIRRVFTRAYWVEFWRSKRRMVVRGAIFGAVIHLLLISHPTRLSAWAEDAALDWAMQNSTALPRPTDPAFVFIDIDDATMNAWPLVPYVPRDKLLQLIKYATNSEAILVHVDVNVTRQINPASITDPSQADKDLQQFLQAYSAPQPSGDPSSRRRPLLILNREMQQTGNAADDCQEVRTSFLDDSVNVRTGFVEWGTVEFDVGPDQEVRFWRLWERACKMIDRAEPSVEEVAAAYYQQCRMVATPCIPKQPADLSLQHGNDISERVVYGIKWSPGNFPEVEVDGKKVPIVDVIQAKDITEADPARPPSAELLRHRIVVIGGTAAFERDMHLTPVGEMPGALIIINAIYSLNRFQRLRYVNTAIEICVALLLIAVASVLFAMLHHLWAFLLTGFLTIVVTLPLGLFAFHRGYWMDFAIPLLAVEAHHFLAEFEEAIRSGGKKREEGA